MRSTGLSVTHADELALDPDAAKQSTDGNVRRQLQTVAHVAVILTDLIDAAAESCQMPTSEFLTSPQSASPRSLGKIEEHLQVRQCINQSSVGA